MRADVYCVLALYVTAYIGVQGYPADKGVISKRDALQQETAGKQRFKKDIDEHVSTVERALDALNELFPKRHHHNAKTDTKTDQGHQQQRRTLIDDRYNKDDILKTGLAIPLEKRSDDDTDPGQRSSLEQQVERLKRAPGKSRALFTLVRRGWWADAWGTLKGAAGSVGDKIKDGYNTLKDKIEDKVDDVKEKWQKLKEVFDREASQGTFQFSDIVKYVDKRGQRSSAEGETE